MQQVIFHPARHTKLLSQATYMLPPQGSGAENSASNDSVYLQDRPVLEMLLSVLANAAGGLLLLTGMLILPYLFAGLLR